MTPDQWLDMNDGQNLRRIAELWTVNGDRLEIEGQIGQIRPVEVNRYKRIGIEIHEAFELTYYRGILDALINSSQNPPATARSIMERLSREARGEMIEVCTVEQLRQMNIWR